MFQPFLTTAWRRTAFKDIVNDKYDIADIDYTIAIGIATVPNIWNRRQSLESVIDKIDGVSDVDSVVVVSVVNQIAAAVILRAVAFGR